MNNNNHTKPLQIAIDGPVGSGKGTLAIALSKRLHAIHIYTGGMYRALTLACLQGDADISNEDAVLDVLAKSKIDLGVDENSPITNVYLNDENVESEIFLPKVSNATPIVAAHKRVREEMVKRQKEIAKDRKAVVEGRDIATHVIPNADLKIYLTATVDERARRRYEQLKEKNGDFTFEQVKEDVINRDAADENRDNSPLAISSDAVVIDTTDDTIDKTVEKVINQLEERNLM